MHTKRVQNKKKVQRKEMCYQTKSTGDEDTTKKEEEWVTMKAL